MSKEKFTQVYKTVSFSSFMVAATVMTALKEYENNLLAMTARTQEAKCWQDSLADVRQAIADFDSGRFA